MITISARTRSTLRATATIVVAALVYEAVARTGYFPPALMPTLPKVWNALVGSLMDGTMIVHAGSTLYRVLVGLGLAGELLQPEGWERQRQAQQQSEEKASHWMHICYLPQRLPESGHGWAVYPVASIRGAAHDPTSRPLVDPVPQAKGIRA